MLKLSRVNKRDLDVLPVQLPCCVVTRYCLLLSASQRLDLLVARECHLGFAYCQTASKMLTYGTIAEQVLMSTGQGPAEDGIAEGFSVKLIIGFIHSVGSLQNLGLVIVSESRFKH